MEEVRYSRVVKNAWGDGYMPHEGMDFVTCPKCGNGVFRCNPQCIPTDAKTWTIEFECTRCKHIVGLTEERR